MITPIFRRLAKARLPDVPGAVIAMAIEARRWNVLLGGETETSHTTTTVIGKTRTRYPVPCAIDTAVSNGGPESAVIYENGKIIFVVQPSETKHLPFGGKGLIHAESDGALIEIVTKSQDCDISYLPPAPVPVGSFLL